MFMKKMSQIDRKDKRSPAESLQQKMPFKNCKITFPIVNDFVNYELTSEWCKIWNNPQTVQNKEYPQLGVKFGCDIWNNPLFGVKLES